MSFRLAFPIPLLLLIVGILASGRIYHAVLGGITSGAPASVAARTAKHPAAKHPTATAHPLRGRHHAGAVPKRTAVPARKRPLARVTSTPRPTATPLPPPTATSTATVVPPTPTPVPVRRRSVSRPTSTPAPTSTPRPVPTATRVRPTATPVRRPRKPIARTRKPVARPSATPTSTPVPIAGAVTLAGYSVTTPSARSGQMVAVTYAIRNTTGRTVRVVLGASIKSSRSSSWVSGVISDPGHDVVAIVPPGTSSHLRYFLLPSALRAGAYDVGWGLLDASTGRPLAFLTASGALRVLR